MALDTFRIFRHVQKHITRINNFRIKHNKPVDFQAVKESMYHMHLEWQSLIRAIKLHESQGQGALAAIRLAAAAVKLATDIGDPVEMKLDKLDQQKD